MYKQKRVPQYMQEMQDQASLWLWAGESAVEDAIANKYFAAAETGYYALKYSVDAYKYLGLVADPASMERKLEELWSRIWALKGV